MYLWLYFFFEEENNQNKVGKYVGVVCFSGITVIIFTRLYLEEIYGSVQNLTLIIISIYLILSIIENIRSVIRQGFPHAR